MCSRQVPFIDINPHMDNGCHSPTPSEIEKATKVKAKKEWSNLFKQSEPTVTPEPTKKGKGKQK